MLADLQGQIERITYTNDENGYTIAKVKVYGRRDLVTVVGNLLAPTPGEILKMQGEWTSHPKYGEQFRVVHYKSLVPASVYGMEKYLGSGLIKGIGPIMAKRIVKTFGTETLEVIEQEIEKLAEVEGIGKKRVEMVRKAWADQKEIRQVMLFLQSHGVSSGYATKIFKTYGNEAIEVVQENPYRLATDIFGIGFLTADRIAEKLGFAKDSELRAEAGILYVLHQLADEGHVYYPLEPLLTKCQEILEVDQEILLRALDTLGADQKIVLEDLEGMGEPKGGHQAVYLAKFHLSETNIAARLKTLITAPKVHQAHQPRQGDCLGATPARYHPGLKAGRSREMCPHQQSGGDYRGARDWQNHHHQCHPQNLCQSRSQVSVGGPHGPGRKTDERGHRSRGQDHSPLAGVQYPEGGLPEKRSDAAEMRSPGRGRSFHDRHHPDAPPP